MGIEAGIEGMEAISMDIEAISMGIEAMGIDIMGIEGRGSSSARAWGSPSDHTGSPMATHPW
jgi:hypothetical protein